MCGDATTTTARAFDELDEILRQHKRVAVIHGAACGADALAEESARERHANPLSDASCDAPLHMPARWDAEGRVTGPKRNE